jgi:ECF transporter S component (folate family)
MKKTNIPLKLAVTLSMLAAISIILGKYLAFGIGNVLRFSFENLPIAFAGIAFGPLAGALVGAVADLVGCLLVGYEINWLVTIGAVAIGLVSGLCAMALKKISPRLEALTVIISVLTAHTIGSVLIKTVGLAAYYAMPFHILMLWRLLNYAIVGGIECLLLLPLMKNRGVKKEIASIMSKHRERKEANDDLH